jgi:hypothetical protein
VQSGLSAFEAYLTSNAPVPFTVGLLWVSLKVHLNQHNQAKEMLEHYLGACAQLVNDGADATPELCAQYTALAQLYAVQVLPRLGMLSTAKSFLDLRNNNVLMSTIAREGMLKEIDDAQARERRKSRAPTSAERNTNPNPAASPNHPSAAVRAAQEEKRAGSAPNEEGSASAASVPQDDDRSSAAAAAGGKVGKGVQRPKGDRPPSLAWEQPLILATGALALGLIVTQRQRIRTGLSTAVQAAGDLMFGAQ